MDSLTWGSIKAQVEVFLTDRCTISEEMDVTDESGSPTHETQILASGVRCRLIRGDKVRLADFGLQETNRETYRLIVAVGVTLTKGQRVTLAGSTSTYELLGIRQNLTDGVFHEALVGVLA